MLNKIIIAVCEQMAPVINQEQMETLKNVLFMSFHNKEVVEQDKQEIIVPETDSDMEKLKIFVASKKICGRKDSTIRQYLNELRACRNAINKNFEDITTMDLRWYLGVAKEKRKNKNSTIKNKIRYLNSFFSFLAKEELIKKNPVICVDAPKSDFVIRKAFTVQNMEAIRKSCTHVRDRALIEFLYATGLRVSEACSLNVGDIDMNQKEFAVIGKGNKERKVYISESAFFHLNEYLNSRGGKEDLTDKPLFAAKRGKNVRMNKNGVEALCRKIGKKAKVENVHPHRFRRTFATNMLNHGMPLEKLAKIMGHSKIETTLIYCDIEQEDVKGSYRKCA